MVESIPTWDASIVGGGLTHYAAIFALETQFKILRGIFQISDYY